MTEQKQRSGVSNRAFRAMEIGPLPISPKERTRVGDELQPFGAYANLNPYHRTVEDIDTVQSSERDDPEFYKEHWWWDHQRLRFLNEKLGFKALILIVPFIWALLVLVGGLALLEWGLVTIPKQLDLSAYWFISLLLILVPVGIFFAFYIIPPTTNWLMTNFVGALLKPFEKTLEKKLDETLEDGCSEFNRVTGQVKFALGKARVFEAPFVEFDAYVERVVQRGGIFYWLMFVHRYTQKQFNKTSLSNIEAEKAEVLALWDMLQRYMDVTQPLPDMPRLEPFRHLDPVTAKYDQTTGRNPRYWRDLDLEEWQKGKGAEQLRNQRQYAWDRRQCRVTPQLGSVDMPTYRQSRPETACAV
ncbi:hypothetical protein KUV44_16490 [Marinobacter daepoensis]|uniref:Uncharacterized protein n=1 Tax=Marinobacter daepoensis TaxID=262077 RepID=A0ABS3BDX0_9GAMM|nr:hypothetical protein [Marinobacter daepoensis]MBN7770033.1 hypothetical protein [Marinobacter daepoensis]MBY6080747.1 hypothetical protein [Marinobacter daepoensis]